VNALLIDSCIIIDVLRHNGAALQWLKSQSGTLKLAATTITEVRAGEKGAREREVFDALLLHFSVVAIDLDIAETAGALIRQYGRSHGVGLGDAQIAATAICGKTALATRNLKHFPMFPHLSAPY